jgi:hypothetical protein
VTNKERVISLVGFEASDTAIEGALIDNDLTAGSTYEKANAVPVAKAAISVLRSLIVSSVKEGGYTINYDKDLIVKRIQSLEKEYGLSEGLVIQDVSHLW